MSDLDRIIAYRAERIPGGTTTYVKHQLGSELDYTSLSITQALVFGGFKQEVREGTKTQYILYICDQLTAGDKRKHEGKDLNIPGNRFDRLLRTARREAKQGQIYFELGAKKAKGEVVDEGVKATLPIKFSQRTMRIGEDGPKVRLAERGKDRITIVAGLPNQKVLALSWVSRMGRPNDEITASDLIGRVIREAQHANEFSLMTQIERVVYGTTPVYENEKILSVANAVAPIQVPLILAIYNDLDGATIDWQGVVRVNIRLDDIAMRAGSYQLLLDLDGDNNALTDAHRQQIEAGVTAMVLAQLGHDLWTDLLVGINSGQVEDGLQGTIRDMFIELANSGGGLLITSNKNTWARNGAVISV